MADQMAETGEIEMTSSMGSTNLNECPPSGNESMEGGCDSTEENLLSSTWVLTECQEFVKRTFSFLSAKQLNTCARVCSMWHKEARRILAQRQKFCWVSDFKSLHTSVETNSHPLGFFGQNLEQTLQSTGSQPRFALMFSEYSKGSEYRGDSSRNGTVKKSQEIVDHIKSLLPSDCVYLSLMTPGTVAPQTGCSTKPCDESESDGGVICTLFPSMPGVDIKILPVAPKLLQGGYKDELWEGWLQAGISPDQTQCILLFGWGFISGVQQAAAELQRLFQEKARRNPVIAGAIVNKLLSKGVCSKSEESSGAIGVMFSGTNVRAASVILSEAIDSREEVRKTLHKLKESGLPTRPGHSLGFMFACSGRGSYFYSEQNVESEEFHRMFPDIPLFGLFGGGEIGCHNLTLGREIDSMCLSAVAHAYTTIMCVISFEPS